MVASTLVVHAPRLRASPQSPVAGVHAPVQPLRPEAQVAVIAFAERAAQLTPERQEELADIAASTADRSVGKESVKKRKCSGDATYHKKISTAASTQQHNTSS